MPQVTFNGPEKLILINTGSTSFEVGRDVYSLWKQWVKTDDNAKYLQALRVVGGDPTVGTQKLDGYFFLVNEWKLVPPADGGTDDIDIDGNLFVDGGGNLFNVSGSNVRVVKLNLSSKSLVNVVSGSGTITTVETASYVSTVENPVSLQPGQLVTASLFPGTSVSASLSSEQSTMLLEIYRLLGLDPTRPLVVSPTERTAGSEISQSISVSGSEYTAQRL